MVSVGLPSPEPYVTGPVGTTIATRRSAIAPVEITGKFDLKAAKIDGASDGEKAAGIDATLNLGVKLSAAAKLLSADFEGKGNGLARQGPDRLRRRRHRPAARCVAACGRRTDVALDWRRNATGSDSLRGRAL